MMKSFKVMMLIGAMAITPGAMAESRASAESAIGAALLPLAATSVAVGIVSQPFSVLAKASREGNAVSVVEGEAEGEELPVTEKIVVGPSPKDAMNKEGE